MLSIRCPNCEDMVFLEEMIKLIEESDELHDRETGELDYYGVKPSQLQSLKDKLKELKGE